MMNDFYIGHNVDLIHHGLRGNCRKGKAGEGGQDPSLLIS
jgi:hypothetical protein